MKSIPYDIYICKKCGYILSDAFGQIICFEPSEKITFTCTRCGGKFEAECCAEVYDISKDDLKGTVK